jgi:TetR/AcrR family transcriptional regulator, mexCD-oprJ operon repressor
MSKRTARAVSASMGAGAGAGRARRGPTEARASVRRPVPEPKADHRRATAEANVAAILDATVALLEHDRRPSFVQIARAAGVSRPTLYAHFPSREDLLAGAVRRAVGHATSEIDAARLGEDAPSEALERLVKTLWRSLSRLSSLAAVAIETLPPDDRRKAHEVALQPVRGLIVRGQESGEFRDDQPPEWLVSVLYALLHGAAEDVAAGRLAEDDVGDLLYASILGAFLPRDA